MRGFFPAMLLLAACEESPETTEPPPEVESRPVELEGGLSAGMTEVESYQRVGMPDYKDHPEPGIVEWHFVNRPLAPISGDARGERNPAILRASPAPRIVLRFVGGKLESIRRQTGPTLR